jgi:EpsD family peptidyl-prolyl cis-trans isomerase
MTIRWADPQHCFRFAGAVFAVALCAACSDEGRGKTASQVAAKVNSEEVSVHQVNYRLQRQPGLKPEQAEAAGRQVLERLIDEELAVQKAQELKLDRDPKVVQAIESARREIIARAYQDRTGDAAARPEPDDIRKYYDANPALFKERRIYTLHEISIEADPAKADELRARLGAAKNIDEFVGYLRASQLRFASSQSVRAAEQLPLSTLPALHKLKDGESLLSSTPTGFHVVSVMSSRSAPIEEAKARPVIEQFLWNENKRRMVQADIKGLRDGAKIEYVGKYAEAAAPAGGHAAASAPR